MTTQSEYRDEHYVSQQNDPIEAAKHDVAVTGQNHQGGGDQRGGDNGATREAKHLPAPRLHDSEAERVGIGARSSPADVPIEVQRGQTERHDEEANPDCAYALNP